MSGSARTNPRLTLELPTPQPSRAMTTTSSYSRVLTPRTTCRSPAWGLASSDVRPIKSLFHDVFGCHSDRESDIMPGSHRQPIIATELAFHNNEIDKPLFEFGVVSSVIRVKVV